MSEPTANDIFNPPQFPPPWQNTAVWPPVLQLTLRNGEVFHFNPNTATPGVIQADDASGGGFTTDARYLTCLGVYYKAFPQLPGVDLHAHYPWEVRATQMGLDPQDGKYDPAQDGDWRQIAGQPNKWVQVVDAPKTPAQNFAEYKTSVELALAAYAATIK